MRFPHGVLLMAALLMPSLGGAEWRGHGGPVRALAISPDGSRIMSGSFDQSAILWAPDQEAALAILRFHAGAVNAVAALPDERFATAGEDGRIAIWRGAEPIPVVVLEAHGGPIVGLAASPDGEAIASASWDGTARMTPLRGGPARVLEGHRGNVNAVAFSSEGRLVTAGYDATLRIWPKEDGAGPLVITTPTPLNGVVAAPEGEIVTAGADGVVRIVTADGQVRAAIETQPSPIVALGVSRDGAKIAAANIGGAVAIIDRSAAKIAFSLVGPGPPVWAIAFTPDGRELLTGGGDGVVRRWNARSGEPVGAVATGRSSHSVASEEDRGARVFQACAVCHTLSPDGGNRAGPSLHGVIGRRIATLPGYAFSDALTHLDIVWTPATISRLFEIGPSRFTPGTKMPEQIIVNVDDRAALTRFLERASAPQ